MRALWLIPTIFAALGLIAVSCHRDPYFQRDPVRRLMAFLAMRGFIGLAGVSALIVAGIA
jgi:hypothetical protein